jgi:hypothetical protein
VDGWQAGVCRLVTDNLVASSWSSQGLVGEGVTIRSQDLSLASDVAADRYSARTSR